MVVLGVTAGAGQRRAGARELRQAGRRHSGGRRTAEPSQVKVDPAKQGQNVADIYLVQPDGRLCIPPEIEARLRKRQDIGLPVELDRRRARPLRRDRADRARHRATGPCG